MSAVYLGRRHKYGAKNCSEGRTEAHRRCGRHASIHEHDRWQELVLLERAGEIRELREQVPFELARAVVLNGRKKPALRYVADFVYEVVPPREQTHPRPGVIVGIPPTVVIEDTTGVMTPVKRIKVHLLALKGLEVRLS